MSGAFRIPVIGELAQSFNPAVVKVSQESQDVNYNDTSPVTIGTIRANQSILVIGVILQIKTAFAGTGTMDIGITGDTDRYYADGTEIDAAGAKFVATAVGAEDAPTSNTNVICTIGAGFTGGVLSVRLVYVDNADLT